MKIIHLIFLLFISGNIWGQNKGVVYNKAIHFQLEELTDTIDFIIVDTVLIEKKPIFLFCQGSLPLPLFIDYEEKGGLFFFGGGISNFNQDSIKKHYHLVVISMPKTPLYAKKSHLNNSLCFIPDTLNKHKFRTDYLYSDNLDNYVKRAMCVLDYLKQKDWVDNEKLIVAGHSQGSKVATRLTSKNTDVTHLGLFGPNPFGRIDQMIRQERKTAEKGLQTWSQANENIKYWNNKWELANNTDSLKLYPELIAWKSFSQPTYVDLLKIDIPIYITYGTEDITSDLCDLLPLLFTSNNKNNLILKRQVGLEHNFFEVDETGRPNRQKRHWATVMYRFCRWTLE